VSLPDDNAVTDEVLAHLPGRSVALWGVLRALVSATVVLGLYFLLPLDRLSEVNPGILLVIALGLLGGLIAHQVRSIARSSTPAIRGIEALAVSVPLLLVLFAAAYYLMSRSDAGSFNEALDRLDSLYFTVTVFTTTGFGDIAATAPLTRSTVTAQMVVDLVVIGLGIRSILGAVRIGRERHASER
jgi:hypothetical protein